MENVLEAPIDHEEATLSVLEIDNRRRVIHHGLEAGLARSHSLLRLLALGNVEGSTNQTRRSTTQARALEEHLSSGNKPMGRVVRPHDPAVDFISSLAGRIERCLNRLIDSLSIIGMNPVAERNIAKVGIGWQSEHHLGTARPLLLAR